MSLGHCRSNTGYTSGNRWVEVTIDRLLGNRNIGIGIATAGFPLTKRLSDRTQVGNYAITTTVAQAGINRDGNIYARSALSASINPRATGPALQQGDVVGIGLNQAIGRVLFRINGVHIHTVSVPVGLEYFLTLGLEEACQVTANLRQSTPFVYSVPAGYTDWAGNAIGSPGETDFSINKEIR
jgi:hypothetical protein